jgi:signal peptidase I
MKPFFEFIWETVKVAAVALVIVLPIRYFVFQPFIVSGQSMTPTFQNGDYLVIDELSYRFREPERGEVVVLKYPHDPSQRYIKRIIGLPGEALEIKDGRLWINGSLLADDNFTPGDLKIILEKDEFFVLGDNRLHSSDSRGWGVLPKENIVGRALWRLWPLAQAKSF